MQYVRLGRTGLRVSAVGLGCGGPSRLGQSGGASVDDAARVVRRALELGINIIDTAEGYGTEPAVAAGIAGVPRDELVLCTKKGTGRRDGLITGDELIAGCEASLARLGVECIDVYQLHGVTIDRYDHCTAELVPAMLRLRQEGKIRYLGITEQFNGDRDHTMLRRALADDCWDTMMVGYNLLNPSAARTVLPECARRGIGTLCMFAVRRALSRPERLVEVVGELVAAGHLAADGLDAADPLGFLREPGVAGSVTEAAYRYCRHTPGMDVVLTGTGDVAHLEENVASLLGPPLPEAVLARLERLFGGVDCVTGQ